MLFGQFLLYTGRDLVDCCDILMHTFLYCCYWFYCHSLFNVLLHFFLSRSKHFTGEEKKMMKQYIFFVLLVQYSIDCLIWTYEINGIEYTAVTKQMQFIIYPLSVVFANFPMFLCEWVDGLWATKSEGVGLIVGAISFQNFQPMWSWSTNVQTDRQMDDKQSQ